MRIFSYRGAVVAAKHFGDALDVLGIDSAAGVFDISGGLKTVPAEILAAYLPAAPLDAKDVEFKRIEAQGLVEKLNAAVLEKVALQGDLLVAQERAASLEKVIVELRDNPPHVIDDQRVVTLQEELAGQIMENQALKENAVDDAAKIKSLEEKVALLEEIEADRKAEAERGVRATFDAEEVDEAELEAIADTWLKNSHSCGVETDLPAVSYCEPAGLSPIYDESGFEIGASSPPPAFDPIATAEAVRDDMVQAREEKMCANPNRKPGEGCILCLSGPCNRDDNSEAAPPVGQEPPMEKRRGGVAAHPAVEKISDILRQDWPAGVAVSTIVSRIEREIEDRPAWASDAGRIGIHATKLGLKRPEGFKRNPVKAVSAPASVADFLSDAAASAALVPVVEKPARDLRSLSRMAQLHGETVQRMADEGMTDGEIANEVNNTARRNDWLTAATAKSVRLEMERVR